MIATTTIDNVERSVEYLVKLPLSHQYKLASNLGILVTEDQKSAFHALDKDKRAQVVLDALLEHDKKGGHVSQQMPLQMQQGFPMQPTQQAPQMPQQMPGGMPQMPSGGMPQMPGGMQQQMPQQMPQQQMPQSMPQQMPQQMPSGGMPMGMPQQMPQGGGMPMGMPQGGGTQPPAPQAARPPTDAISQLAEAMKAVAAAQEKMAAELNLLNAKIDGATRVNTVSLMAMIAYIEHTASIDHNTYMEYLRGRVSRGEDQKTLQEIVGKG